MEYKIVTSDSTPELEEMVNELIMQGWKPLGGVSIFRKYNNTYEIQASQAMIKE